MAMTIPFVPSQNTGQGTITLAHATSAYSALWWTSQTIASIPAESVGWLVAQGWGVVNVEYDETTTPPTPYYNMGRQSLQNWQILQSLLNSWTIAYNEARDVNSFRYNQVVENWATMLSSSHTHFDAETTEQNASVSLYLGNLATYMDQVDVLIEENRAATTANAATVSSALSVMNAKLSDLEGNYTTHAATITNLIASQLSYLVEFVAGLDAQLSSLDTTSASYQSTAATLLATADGTVATYEGQVEALLASVLADYTAFTSEIDDILDSATTTLNSHAADYESILALLLADYTTHETTATGYLTGLGTTELARIAEKFASTLSAQLQQLVDRGMYSGALVVDVTARNTRDKNEEIAQLNDKLNREKLTNEHQLYEQKVGLRKSTLDGKDRLHNVRHEVLRYKALQLSQLHAALADVRNRTLGTRNSLYATREGYLKLSLASRSDMYEKATAVIAQHIAGVSGKATAQQQVTAAIAATRDRLLGGLQDAVKGVLAGKERFAALMLQNGSTLAEQRNRIVVEKMNEHATRLTGLEKTHADNMKLMAYQLDERNKLIMGLYGFVERRTDIGPSIEDLAKICTSLGDAGGGWLSP
jgi:hypothetical protein